MTSDLDIYRAARLLVDEHGEEASFEAALGAEAMLERDDLDGAAVWKRILGAIRELQDREPARPGTAVH